MPPPPPSDWVWHGRPTSLLPNGTFKDLSLKWEPVVNRLNSLAALAVMAEWNIRQLSLRIFLSLSGKRPLVASFRAPSFVSRTDRILPAFCPCYRGVAGLLSRPTESLLCDWRGANAITLITCRYQGQVQPYVQRSSFSSLFLHYHRGRLPSLLWWQVPSEVFNHLSCKTPFNWNYPIGW